MTDDRPSDGVLMIRAWKQPDGSVTARVTRGYEGEQASIAVATVGSSQEILEAVRGWLGELAVRPGSDESP